MLVLRRSTSICTAMRLGMMHNRASSFQERRCGLLVALDEPLCRYLFDRRPYGRVGGRFFAAKSETGSVPPSGPTSSRAFNEPRSKGRPRQEGGLDPRTALLRRNEKTRPFFNSDNNRTLGAQSNKEKSSPLRTGPGNMIRRSPSPTGQSGGKAAISHQQNQASRTSRNTTPIQQPSKADKLFKDWGMELQRLYQMAQSLPALPFLWETYPTPLSERQNRQALVKPVFRLIQSMKQSLKDGTLNPVNYRHAHYQTITTLLQGLAQLLNKAMAITLPEGDQLDTNDEQVPSSGIISVFDVYLQLLDLIKSFKMEVSYYHCQAALEAAGREGRWVEAARLFWQHLDQNQFHACDISLDNPVALYTLARAAQEQNAAVVENVLEGVVQLSILSPTDQGRYLLAAGTAIGRAGEWEAFVNYTRASYTASQMGQPLVAAVMHACLLCQQPDEAIHVFDVVVGNQLDIGGERQWAGGQYNLDPICRDLAMRALGDSHRQDCTRAVNFYHEVKREGYVVSTAALGGVLKACENSEGWELSLRLLLDMMQSLEFSTCVVPGDGLEISEEVALKSREVVYEYLGELLAPVIRACNSAGKFGVSLLATRLFELSLPRERRPRLSLSIVPPPLSLSIFRLLEVVRNSEELLPALLVALCGAGETGEAADLLETFRGVDPSCFGISTFLEANELRSFVEHEIDLHKRTSLISDWEAIHRQIYRVTSAATFLSETGHRATDGEGLILSSGLAVALRCCVAASQHEVGHQLAAWIEGKKLNIESKNGSSPFVNPLGQSNLIMTDNLMSATLKLLRSGGKLDDAEAIIFAPKKEHASEALTSLESASFRISRGMSTAETKYLHRSIPRSRRSPDLFSNIAGSLVDSKDWQSCISLYQVALSNGCLSEELGLLAIKSVLSGRVSGRVQAVRSIVEDIAGLTATTPQLWIESKYWYLKRSIGFANVASLLRWEDPETAHLDELNFALKAFDDRISAGLSPKIDALRLIINAAKDFSEDFVPVSKTEVDLIPRDHDGFKELLVRVVTEAEGTKLVFDRFFVNDVAKSFLRFNLDMECLEFLKSAVLKGTPVQPKVLRASLEAIDSRHPDSADLKALGTLN